MEADLLNKISDMHNSMYYTFSTIAQVLAAFIALGGVFVIFKVQSHRKALLTQLKQFIDAAGGIVNDVTRLQIRGRADLLALRTLYESESVAGLIDEMDKILHNPIFIILSHERVFLNEKRRVSSKIINNRKLVMILTHFSLIIGVLTILFSIVILSMVHKDLNNLSECLFFIGFIGLGGSIILMILAIIISLKELRIPLIHPDELYYKKMISDDTTESI